MIYCQISGLTLELNDNIFKAKVSDSNRASGDIFIPYSIQFETHNYIITSIKEGAFKNNNKIIV